MTAHDDLAGDSPRWMSIPASLALIAAFGVIDTVAGFDFGSSLFYLLPISLTTLAVGTTPGLMIAVVSAATGLFADLAGGHQFPLVILPYWNSAVRLTIFVVVAFLVGQREVLLAKTLRQVKTLKGLLPICASCKSIKDDQGQWIPLERYLQDRTEAGFTHGLCPACLKKLYPQFSSN